MLWLGPVIAYGYYAGLHRNWGPNPRVDQSIGAGILWIVGDVLGVPFLAVLLRGLSTHEGVRIREVDAEADAEAAPNAGPTLWWDADPQLGERFGRR